MLPRAVAGLREVDAVTLSPSRSNARVGRGERHWCPADPRDKGPSVGEERGGLVPEHRFFRSCAPPEPLRPYIASFWLYEGYRPAHTVERALPTATVEVVIPLAGQSLVWHELSGARDECRGAVVSGPRRSAFELPTAPQVRLAGIHFHSGGAWPLLGAPMDALAGHHVPLDVFCGPVAHELTRRLEQAPGDAARFALLAAFCLRLLRAGRSIHGAVRAGLDRLRLASEDPKIADLVAASGLSHRRFIALFRREVGLTPHEVARLRRFHAALARSRDERPLAGAHLAAESGYFDQSHWRLECTKLAGLAPRALIAASRAAGAVLPEFVRGQILPMREVEAGPICGHECHLRIHGDGRQRGP
jgi:AraC-like DNA-binding protein